MSFDLAALGIRVSERAPEWEALGLAWSAGPIHPNYGKAVTSVDFDGAGWTAQITIWETGETELVSVRLSDRLTVDKHFDLESVAALDTALSEFAALVRDGVVPTDAVVSRQPSAEDCAGSSVAHRRTGKVRAMVRAVATRWLSEDFPGFIEVVVTDAHQVAHIIHDKAPVLSRAEWSSSSGYPREIWIEAEVLSEHEGIVTVRLAHSVESLDGRTDFDLPVELVRASTS